MSGKVGRQAGYETGETGDPDGCLPDYTGIPDPPDTSQCGEKTIARSSTSYVERTLGTDDLFLPGGENPAGEGNLEGRWKVKLTRIG